MTPLERAAYTYARRCQMDGAPCQAAVWLGLLAEIETYRDTTLTMAQAERIVGDRVAKMNWRGESNG